MCTGGGGAFVLCDVYTGRGSPVILNIKVTKSKTSPPPSKLENINKHDVEERRTRKSWNNKPLISLQYSFIT